LIAEIEGYFEQARDTRSVEFELVGGSQGVFDVVVDGQLVYSKYQTGQFPNVSEVTAKL